MKFVEHKLATGAMLTGYLRDETTEMPSYNTRPAVLILPGGAGAWVLRDTPEVIHLVKKMHAAGKLVAAICAAPIVLAKAGLVKDKNVTAYPAQDVYRELNEAGAHIVKDENVVLDGNMLTANGPGAAMLFGYCIGEYLGEDLQVAQLKEQMCYTGL